MGIKKFNDFKINESENTYNDPAMNELLDGLKALTDQAKYIHELDFSEDELKYFKKDVAYAMRSIWAALCTGNPDDTSKNSQIFK